MPLFQFSKSDNMSTDPQIRQSEKNMAKEAQADQKALNHAIKDLSGAEKTHSKSVQASEQAQHALDKAIKTEQDAATALNKAHHAHNSAVTDQQAAEKTLSLKQQQENQLMQDLEQKRINLDGLKQRKATNDQQREMKLSELHAQVAARTGSLDTRAQQGGPMTTGGGPSGVGQ